MVGRFYVAVVHVVLLFGSETWEMMPQLEEALEGFHHWEVWRLEGMGPNSKWDGTWVYPPIGAALVTVGLDEIEVYFDCRHNMVVQ